MIQRDTADEGEAGPQVAALERAAVECSTLLYPQQELTVLGRPQAADWAVPEQHFASLGEVTVGDVQVGRDVRLDCGEIPSYHVNVPLTGRLASRHRGRDVMTEPGGAAVYRPEGETLLTRWPGDCRQLCVKLDRHAVEETLADLLGDHPKGTIAFEARMNTASGFGRSWVDMLLMISRQLHLENSIITQPIVAGPLAEALVRGFLLAACHPQRDEMDTRKRLFVEPMPVRRAIEIIESDPKQPLTTSLLARQCNVSVRTLQDGFQRHVGMSPMAYLRDARLRRAHEELRRADPYRRTVTSIALEWGFTHVGRFAAAHERKYGQSPTETLRTAH